MELVSLHNVVVSADDLRMPIHLSAQLSGSELDKDVKESMMELLQGPSAKLVAQNNTLRSMGSNPKYRASLEGADSNFKLTLAILGTSPGLFVIPTFERKLEVRIACYPWTFQKRSTSTCII